MAATVNIVLVFLCIVNVIRIRNEPPTHHLSTSKAKYLPASLMSSVTLGLRRNVLEFQPSKTDAPKSIFRLALLLSGDIQVNPGPQASKTHVPPRADDSDDELAYLLNDK